MKQIIVTGEYREQFILPILPSLSYRCGSQCIAFMIEPFLLHHMQTFLNWILNHWYVAFFGRLENMAPILHKAFSYANAYVKYSSHILLISLWCLPSLLILICSNLLFIYLFNVLVDASIEFSEHATSLVLEMPCFNSLNHSQAVVLIE